MKCPYCDVELEIEDSVDISIGWDTLRESVIGICPKCEKNFMWDRIYNFTTEVNCEEY